MNRQRSPIALLAGLGVGAALMYFLDRDRGAQRRHEVGDKASRVLRTGQRQANDLVENARNRVRGVAAEVRGRVRREAVTDEQLIARVRAELGHHVEHARAVDVIADGGLVTLRGVVAATEVPGIVRAVSHVRGVKWVDNQLEARTAPGLTPSVQS